MENQNTELNLEALVDAAAGEFTSLEALAETATDAVAADTEVVATTVEAAVTAAGESEKGARGRKPRYEDRWNLVDDLTAIRENGHTAVSRVLKLQLVEMGMLQISKIEKETVGRGRPAHDYALTGNAKKMLGLAKNWKRPVTDANA